MKMKDSVIFKFNLQSMNESHEDAIERLSNKDINGFIAHFRSAQIRDAYTGSMCKGLDDEIKCREELNYILDKQDVDIEKMLRKTCIK